MQQMRGWVRRRALDMATPGKGFKIKLLLLSANDIYVERYMCGHLSMFAMHVYCSLGNLFIFDDLEHQTCNS